MSFKLGLLLSHPTITMSRHLLILDLDETLIYATEERLEIQHDFQWESYFIYQRPFVRPFLEACVHSYDVAIWTSASEDYARGVCATLFEGLVVKFLWARERCTLRIDKETQIYYWVKNLKKVKRAGYDLERVLMVDDTPRKLESQYGNLVTVKEFTGDTEDRELLHLAAYLKSLAREPNVRQIEKRGWRNFSN